LFPHLSNVDHLFRFGTIAAEVSFAAAIEAGGVLDAIDVHGCAISLGHGSFFRGDRRDVVLDVVEAGFNEVVEGVVGEGGVS
jgi:hypothetical protein